tara:strand:+ start:192 stop:431 length:240 start_codon:yes stop_codon:yes gene_type:complete
MFGLGKEGSGEPATTNISLAIKNDMESQDTNSPNHNRLARAAIRAVRATDDKVFKAAGVDPKHHRENFEKIIDEIMKGL